MIIEELKRTPAPIQKEAAVERAKLMLYLRSTTQISELLKHSSLAVQQRWDFLGSQSSVNDIDYALQWDTNGAIEIGQCIRQEEFCMELTSSQEEFLNTDNVRFKVMDVETVHAFVPFAPAFVVDLVWENEEWVYFGTQKTSTAFPTGLADVAATVEEAERLFCESRDEDSDYWGHSSSGADHPADAHQGDTQDSIAGLPQSGAAAALPYLMTTCAKCAHKAGVTETEFVQLAQAIYRSDFENMI
ncbi:hypothetical protein GGI25_006348 [Coemansia spiralis]|uniref:Uncharacterized protein n=2 Tax=Coemansia TaxID=4863 RepID=A0A9W8G0T8_9FUNG|nr:hypothetical protein EDC05_006261 [Coemansia umbellata]KAJ2622666.1 hypothetical protein GGI26_003112 [Coemansia sp. RSA 1358]KAJ2668793.1 hypothetical protein GGI25_006348 [Coemansia spiralis]